MPTTTNPIALLLNQGTDSSTEVSAPAFSITKVISTSALILTPIATLLTNRISNTSFSAGQYVILIVAVLALLAITSASDVLARAVSSRGSASTYIPIYPALPGVLETTGKDPAVQIIAVRSQGSSVEFLVFTEPDTPLVWAPQAKVTLGTAAPA